MSFWNFIFSRVRNPVSSVSSHTASAPAQLRVPLLASFQMIYVSPVWGVQSNECWLDGNNFSQSAGCAALSAAQMLLGYSASPSDRSAELVSSQSLPACISAGLVLPWGRTLHLSLNVISPLLHPVSRSLRTVSLLLSVSTGPPRFGIMRKLDESGTSRYFESHCSPR